MTLDANARRFSGFADLYDAVRPVPPALLPDVLTAYAGGRPALTVDLGSGTGLSTRWAATWSEEVVGVEPSDDMRQQAGAVADDGNVRYVAGWSNATGLGEGCADVVIAVQALHWMEPTSTFAEVARILRPGGVFAAIDCDWPPSVGDARAEQAWHSARAKIAEHERRLAGWDGSTAPVTQSTSASPQSDDLRPTGADRMQSVTIAEGVQYWQKGQHLRRLVDSQRFFHCVEVCALGAERGTAARLIGLFKSQGDYQAMRRNGIDDDALGVTELVDRVDAALGVDERPFWFTYRARIGVLPTSAG